VHRFVGGLLRVFRAWNTAVPVVTAGSVQSENQRVVRMGLSTVWVDHRTACGRDQCTAGELMVNRGNNWKYLA